LTLRSLGIAALLAVAPVVAFAAPAHRVEVHCDSATNDPLSRLRDEFGIERERGRITRIDWTAANDLWFDGGKSAGHASECSVNITPREYDFARTTAGFRAVSRDDAACHFDVTVTHERLRIVPTCPTACTASTRRFRPMVVDLANKTCTPDLSHSGTKSTSP
jgi:hypothetical protein